MFQAQIDPLCGSLPLSAAVACIPLIVFFVCLVGYKFKAHISAIIALGVSIIVAVLAFKMPLNFTLLSASEGFVYGLFPISIIMFSAVWFYELTVASGRSKDLSKLFDTIGNGDVRIQAIIIAFCFGALLESLAGFGAPIAITSTMILALGIPPKKTAIAVLLANTAPVAFGSMALPITTAANTAPGIEGAAATAVHTASITGIICPLFSFLIPCLVLIIIDGKQGLKDCFIPALVIGISFAITQYVVSNYLQYEMTDIFAALVSFVVAIIFMYFWKPKEANEYRARVNLPKIKNNSKEKLVMSRVFMAILPYLIIIAVLSLTQNLIPLKSFDIKVPWPGLTEVANDGTVNSLILNYQGTNPGTIYNFCWISNCGSLMIIAGIIVTIIYSIFTEHGRYKMSFKIAAKTFVSTLFRIRYTVLTIGCVLSLSYVMNFSGQTISIGHLIAGTGILYAFLSPVLGWVGTAVTGSDTSANALFSNLQVEAVKSNSILAQVQPELFLASNTMGGVIGKMISPQSLAIAAASTKNEESGLFKSAIKVSVILLLVLCVIILLYAFPLNFLVP